MTDSELIDYLGMGDMPREIAQVFIGTLTPQARATYEGMKTVEEDIKLWQEGVGPKPTGVIMCHDHTAKTKGDQT